MSNDGFKKGLDSLDQGPAPSDAPADGAPPQAANLPPHPTVDAMRAEFGSGVLRHEVVAGDEHIVYIPPERNHEILGWLRDTQGYDFLQDLTAVDYGGGRAIQVVYQLWSIPHKLNLRVKCELPLDALEIETTYFLWRAADWLEREVYDMFGVVFRGHPDLRRILMPYNYAEGHPLRKDFPLRGRFSRAEQTRRALSMKTEDHYSPQELETAHALGQGLPEVFNPGEASGGGGGFGGIGEFGGMGGAG
jgi:NADH-quinone oxidoreductase subunit C